MAKKKYHVNMPRKVGEFPSISHSLAYYNASKKEKKKIEKEHPDWF